MDQQHSVSPSSDLYQQRLILQTEFNLISTKQSEQMMFKSRQSWYEYGERASKMLAHQLRKSESTHVIPDIKTQSGHTTTEPTEINKTFQNFYSNLYKPESLNNPELFDVFFEELPLPTLDSQFRDKLEMPITLEEIKTAIRLMQSGKSPGPDGFPVEFFKTFSESLSPLLREMYIESLNTGHLPPSLEQATISLLLKPNKDPRECSSYRPISLLNVDFKILSKTLALRFEQCLPSLISSDQTGFVKGRHGFFNLCRLFNILYTPSSPLPEIALSLDAERAFDRVEWDYLYYTLNKFGFGKNLISWIKLLYSSPMARVRTNTSYSQFFSLHRGTRQGCPLSPLLFAICIEPLAIKLRSNNRVKGIQRANQEHKVSLYADDLLLFIADPLNSLPHAFSIFQEFGDVSGYKLNLLKSECLIINSYARELSFQTFPFKIKTEYLTYLGI